MTRPLAIELFAGLHGWGAGFAAAGFRVIGFDIANMGKAFGAPTPDGCQLVIQDVLTLHGSQFRDAAVIVASPPCQNYSYLAMPWSRSKSEHSQKAKAMRKKWETEGPDNRLFDACFRIQREAIEARMRGCPTCGPGVKYWRRTKDGDESAFALFRRHYSCDPMRNQQNFWPNAADKQFVGPGEKLVLMTQDARALYAFRAERFRMDGQIGINCAVFRNEGTTAGQSSELIRAADDLAWTRWPGQRIFTFVDAAKVRHKRDPGRCFKRAGYRQCGETATGKLIFERFPESPASLNPCPRCYIPLIVENVRGAQPWVGRSAWNYGSFHLWGDVPALMPITLRRGQKVPGFRFDGSGGSFQTASVEGMKGTGAYPNRGWTAGCAIGLGLENYSPGENAAKLEDGTNIGGDWFGDSQSTCRKHGSRSNARKMASAMIAKIPRELAEHIARVYYPRPA